MIGKPGLLFSDLREASARRQAEWPGSEAADLSFRALEVGGETGELLEALKKYRRSQLGIKGSTATRVGAAIAFSGISTTVATQSIVRTPAVARSTHHLPSLMLIAALDAAKIKTDDTSDRTVSRLPDTAAGLNCVERAGFEDLMCRVRGTRFGRYFIHG